MFARHSALFTTTLLAAALLLAACAEKDVDPPATGGPAECTDGERQCSEEGVVEVCVAGRWATLLPCPAEHACEDGECVETPCTPSCGERACGPDGCGGSCGLCEGAEVCTGAGECVDTSPGCGDGECAADGGEDCVTCHADCACADGEVCDLGQRGCVPACERDCAGRVCGPDGCGGSCGLCAGAEVCTGAGECADPSAGCGDGECVAEDDEDCRTCAGDCGACCGDGECVAAHGEDCVTCYADCGCDEELECDLQQRACVPPCGAQCEGRDCGPDGCGGTCGPCGAGELCTADGACVSLPRACGDGVCVADQGEDCTTCALDCGVCCGDGDCQGGLGEDCVTCHADCGCADDAACDLQQRECVPVCVPMCGDRGCGPNGCGGECGPCPAEQVCAGAGECVPPPPRCGDGECDAAQEDCRLCPADCGLCCGDAECRPEHGEDCATCLLDCACGLGQGCDLVARRCVDVCQPDCQDRQCGPDSCGAFCGPGCPADQVCDAAGVCVAAPPDCGDDVCEAPDEDCSVCPADCGACCGDEECLPGHGEDCAVCPADCGCAEGELCEAESRTCVPGCQANCTGRVCGSNGCDGSCGQCAADQRCVEAEGRCEPLCDRDCEGRVCGGDGCGGQCGACAADQVCSADGQCLGGGLGCDCADGELCLDGVCRGLGTVCAPEQPAGLCPSGQHCVAGVCRTSGAACSQANPSGPCPLGQVCRQAACVELDAAALCDDGNPCTFDTFDYLRSRCVSAPAELACDDGDPCTTDACVHGACVGEPVDGCVAPPTIDPWVSPTNEGELTLTGSKASGAAIEINGREAVPTDLTERWSVTLNLVPGDNVYAVRSTLAGDPSEARQVHVVYDVTPPEITITPDGGVFPDGITVTVAASEPAELFLTTDGSPADEHAPRFWAWRTLRVFDDTVIRVTARDAAGNWAVAPVEAAFEISTERSSWQDGLALPAPRTHAGVASDGSWLYVAGGFDGEAARAECWRYRPSEDGWEELASLPSPREQFALVMSNGALYAFGGQEEGEPLNGVARLVPGDDGWTQRRAMPSTRFGVTGAAVGSRIYVMGGKTNGGVVLDTHEVYTPNGDTWANDVAPLPRPRYAAATVAHDGRIYLLGGEDEQGRPVAAVDVYDTNNNTWSTLPDLPEPRSFLAAGMQENVGAVSGGPIGIVVAGGRQADGTPSAAVHEYVFDTNVWRVRRSLPRPLHSLGGATLRATGVVDTQEQQVWVVGGQPGAEGAALSDDARAFVRSHDYLSPLSPLPEGRFLHAAVPLDGRIYVLGGRDFQETVLGWVLDPESGQYASIADLPSEQSGLAALEHDGRIWAFGGTNAFGNAVPTVRSYDPAADVWQAHQPMLTARARASAVKLGGRLYVIGGDNRGAVPTVEIYDPESDRWAVGPLLPEARAGAAAVAWRGDVYLAGGRNAEGQQRGTLLRLRQGAWTQVEANTLPVADAAVAVINGQLNLLGGRVGGNLSDRHWAYGLSGAGLAFEWLPPTRLMDARDLHSAAVVNGEIYLLGGNVGAAPGPNGVTVVHKLRGRCFDGIQAVGEGAPEVDIADAGAGCGAVDPFVRVNPGHAYARHGGCGSWNTCGSAHNCAQHVCTFFGHGQVLSYDTSNDCDSTPGQQCDVFYNDGSRIQNYDWSGCALPAVYNVACFRN